VYAKIFSQIYDSSIVENPELRFTFMDLLVLADPDGVVDMTHEAISRRTNRPIEIIRSTIQELESPDPRSRTKDDQGRRLRRLDDHRDWGWVIINYDRFRDIATEAQRREKTKERVRKHREKTRCNVDVTPVTKSNTGVTSPYASASASVSVPVRGGAGETLAEVESPYLNRPSGPPFKLLQQKLCVFWKRDPNARWNDYEEHLALEIAKRPDVLKEFEEIQAHRPKDQHPRKTLPSMLEHWQGELDKARNHKDQPQNIGQLIAQLRAIEQQIERHPANRESVHCSQTPTPEEVANLKDLRAKKNTLTSVIANARVQ
jgi:hypothetical protein